MSEIPNRQEAVELLQQLGLKEYEAKCYVALSRMESATAKEISEHAEVPRTRVYDANRVLEAKGIVEVQHSSPQRFRAVPVDEALKTLRSEYESRMSTLQNVLQHIEPVESTDDEKPGQEVWSLSGRAAIDARCEKIVDRAADEVFYLMGSETTLTDEIVAAVDRGVDVTIGVTDEAIARSIRNTDTGARVFVSDIEWLQSDDPSVEPRITRMLLVDQNEILIASTADVAGEPMNETAVFGRGFTNGLVVIIRQLMTSGLLAGNDPAR